MHRCGRGSPGRVRNFGGMGLGMGPIASLKALEKQPPAPEEPIALLFVHYSCDCIHTNLHVVQA